VKNWRCGSRGRFKAHTLDRQTGLEEKDNELKEESGKGQEN